MLRSSCRPVDRRRRWAMASVGAPALIVAALALAGCGGNSAATDANAAAVTSSASGASASSADPKPQAKLGNLVISGGFVPQPASPDVAAAYLTITNQGERADALVAVRSDAGSATLHRTVGGAMVPLDQLDVPAHASAAFAPGANHIMIENPTRALKKGDQVALTLVFQQAGAVSVHVPVTGYPTGGTDMGGMDMGGTDTGGGSDTTMPGTG